MADFSIQKPDTNCVRKMTIGKLDGPVFGWLLYYQDFFQSAFHYLIFGKDSSEPTFSKFVDA
jgi:uncharacterized membrane protein YpjA